MKHAESHFQQGFHHTGSSNPIRGASLSGPYGLEAKMPIYTYVSTLRESTLVLHRWRYTENHIMAEEDHNDNRL
jgi:hypothetical protein